MGAAQGNHKIVALEMSAGPKYLVSGHCIKTDDGRQAGRQAHRSVSTTARESRASRLRETEAIDGRGCVAGTAGDINIWDLQTGACRDTLSLEGGGGAYLLHVSRDGRYIAAVAGCKSAKEGE